MHDSMFVFLPNVRGLVIFCFQKQSLKTLHHLNSPIIHNFCPKVTCPEFQTMILFSDCMSHTLTILDDIEMYEKHKPFALGNFVTLSTVINQFLFKAIWSNLILDTTSPLFISLHSLLSVLYRRDNRRPFTRPNHWLIKDIKAKELIR